MVSKVPITHIIDSVLKQSRASENLPEENSFTVTILAPKYGYVLWMCVCLKYPADFEKEEEKNVNLEEVLKVLPGWCQDQPLVKQDNGRLTSGLSGFKCAR